MGKQYGDADAKRLGLLDPTNGPTQAKVQAILPRLANLKGKRIGLLDNSKTNAAALLAGIGEILIEQYGVAEFVARSKVIYSRVAPQELLDEIAGHCDAVVTAIGD